MKILLERRRRGSTMVNVRVEEMEGKLDMQWKKKVYSRVVVHWQEYFSFCLYAFGLALYKF